MQAPTTPNGPPVHDPDERTCANCGAANGLAAAFCWRCYRPFGAHAAPPGLAGAPGRAPGRPDASPLASLTGWAPGSAGSETKSGGISRVAAIVLVTVGLIGGAYWFVSRPDVVTIPVSFGGLSRIENTQTEFVAEAFRSEVEGTGIEGDLALYGDGLPTTALIWIRDAAVPTTEAAFDAFASGFEAGIGQDASLDPSRKTTETVDGVTYVCAPVVGATPGTICMWQEDSIFWLLFEFSGQGQTGARSLAVVANDAVRSG
jgi:hypothetical protein